MEVHAAGCRDIRGRGHWTFAATALEDAAYEVASDFIDEGSMTLADAIDVIHFAPCVRFSA